MKKSRVVLLVVISIVITMLVSVYATYNYTSNTTATSEDKILISQKELDEYQAIAEEFGKVIMLKEFIKNNFYIEVDEEMFLDGVLKGLFDSLDDPYSVYFTANEYKDFNETSSGTYGGIGIQIAPDDRNLINIVAPFEDTPGARAGLKTNDRIIKVNGEEVYADQMDYAISQMKGEPGTDVTLTILREGMDPFDVLITREQIVLKSVKSRVIDDIGYLRITSFDSKVFEEFKEHLDSLEDQGIKGLIIDLRSNPGGSFDQVVEIADTLLGKQVIVSTRYNNGEEEVERSDNRKVNLPITVLVNGGSASASEILTGAIQDSESGVVIGTTTFGKGLVQTVRGLQDGTGFKLTIAQYFTPNGTYIHGVGIEPDIVLEIPDEAYDDGELTDEEDVQLQKAIEIINNQIN